MHLNLYMYIKYKLFFSFQNGQELQIYEKDNFRNKSCVLIFCLNQLFLENVSSIDVTQLSTQPGPGTKKRRLESGWCYVLEFLSDREQHVQMIPWIQLVTRFVEKYPQNFPQEQIAPYLATIANQIGDFKRYET